MACASFFKPFFVQELALKKIYKIFERGLQQNDNTNVRYITRIIISYDPPSIHNIDTYNFNILYSCLKVHRRPINIRE